MHPFSLAAVGAPPAEPSYGWWLPPDLSTYGPTLDWGFKFIHVFMVVQFVLWGIFFAYCLVRFRARAGQRARPHGLRESVGMTGDLVIAAVDVGLILFYVFPVWGRVVEQLPPPNHAVHVEVTGEQFVWNIRYPGPDGTFGRTKPDLISTDNPLGIDPADPAGKDDVTTIGELHLPVGRPVIVHLRSKDVIHSFFIPVLRVKRDAVPGLTQELWVEATQAGHFEIACAQLCGLGHYTMRGDVLLQSPEEYDAWLQAQEAALQAQPPAVP